MKKVCIEILNEIVNAKNQITLTLKLSTDNILITIGDYKHIIKRYPHLKNIQQMINDLRDANCMVDEIQELLNSTVLIEQWTYIIKKPKNLTAKTQSTVLYTLNSIEAEYIDYTYTGNLIPTQTGGIIQRLVIDTDENNFKIDINSISGQVMGLINIYQIPKDKAVKPEDIKPIYITIMYERHTVDIEEIEYKLKDEGYNYSEIDSILKLIELYLEYL